MYGPLRSLQHHLERKLETVRKFFITSALLALTIDVGEGLAESEVCLHLWTISADDHLWDTMEWILNGCFSCLAYASHLSPRLCPFNAGCSPPSMSSIVVCLFSELGCSFRPNIFLSISLWAVLCLSIVYWETMFGSHRSLLARHIGPLLVFLSEMGSCLSWSISLFFFFCQNSSRLLWSWHRLFVCGLCLGIAIFATSIPLITDHCCNCALCLCTACLCNKSNTL